jgi:hypothetical protein
LDKVYESKLEEAIHTYRKGDIKSYVIITAENLKYKYKYKYKYKF